MTFSIILTDEALNTLHRLAKTNHTKYNKVRKTIGLMETNLKSNSLNTHPYKSITGPNGEKIFESYVENVTPAAFRVFWHYGPGEHVITVIAITPHP